MTVFPISSRNSYPSYPSYYNNSYNLNQRYEKDKNIRYNGDLKVIGNNVFLLHRPKSKRVLASFNVHTKNIEVYDIQGKEALTQVHDFIDFYDKKNGSKTWIIRNYGVKNKHFQTII